MLADECKIHASVRQLSKTTHFFPAPGEKNAHSLTRPTTNPKTPGPLHFNVAGEAHEPADANVRFFRPRGWTPRCSHLNIEMRGQGVLKRSPAWSVYVFFARDGPWAKWLGPAHSAYISMARAAVPQTRLDVLGSSVCSVAASPLHLPVCFASPCCWMLFWARAAPIALNQQSWKMRTHNA